MKILIYSANYAPEPTGIGKYSGEMAEWLAAKGHDVRVVAAPPYYPHWKLADEYKWPLYRREVINGIDVWRAPIWVPSQPSGLKRILHLLSFTISSAPVMLRQVFWSPDVVFTVAPAMSCAPVGWLTARLCGAQAWLHIQDFEVDVAFRMNQLKGRWLKSFALGCEKRVMRAFDKVSTISHKMVQKLHRKGVDASAVEHLPNWVDVQGIAPLHHVSSYRAELNIPEHANVALFSGTWGAKQDLMLIPAVAEQLKHRSDIYFVICGDGVMRPQIEQATHGMDNVRLLPLQPKERLGELLGLADIHLLTQSADAEDLVLPSKLTGMLASGRPVVATCREDTEIGHVVSRCGRVVAPGSVDELAAAIVGVVDRADMMLSLGAAGRLYAEQVLSRDAILSEWMQTVQTGHIGLPAPVEQ